MKIITTGIVFLLSYLFCIALDMVWISVFMKKLYSIHLQHISRVTESGNLNPHILAVLFVWALLCAGIALFVVSPEPLLPSLKDLLWGALFGCVVYGVYDWTNFALLKDWPLYLCLIDWAWGTFLCAITAYIMRFFYALLL